MTGLPTDLPDAARAYLAALPPGRVEAFSMTPLDRTGIPCWNIALFLDDSVEMPGALPSGVGYGATDGDAITGALGECVEAVFPTLAVRAMPRERATYHDLVRVHGHSSVADPLQLCLPAGSPVDRDFALDWVAATRHATGEAVLVPIDIAGHDHLEMTPGYKPFTKFITNGSGAGPDVDWAVGHGLLELLQRDGNGLLFRALDQGVALDLDEVSPECRQLLDHFAAIGITVIPKYATDAFGLANLYVVGHDDPGHPPAAPIMVSACGEACDPDRDRALAKALREFAAARVRKTFAHGPMHLVEQVAPAAYGQRFVQTAHGTMAAEDTRAVDAMVAWARMDVVQLQAILAPVYAVRERKPFSNLPKTPYADGRQRRQLAVDAVTAAGLDVLYVDCSPADRAIGMVRVIVPGLEVETMSYSRIGARGAAKLIARGDPMVRFGTPTATLLPIRMPTEDAAAQGHPLFDTALAAQIVGDLYPLYREPDAMHVAHELGLVSR